MATDTSHPIPDNPLGAIPDPTHVRWVIGMRYAEILVLKKLLRAAESRDRLFSTPTRDRSPEGVSRGD
jgi:hypothetical protein